MTRPKGSISDRRFKRLVRQVGGMRATLERIDQNLASVRRKLAGSDG